MKRRNFLKSAAATFPFALSHPFALGTEPSEFPIKEGHVVLAGEDINSENRTLGFSHISFKISTQETGGNFFLFEHSNLVPGGPPLHFHYDQEEWFYVMEGEVLFQIGEKRIQLKAGDSRTPQSPPCLHSSWGQTRKDADCLLARGQDGAVFSRYGPRQGRFDGCKPFPQVRL